MLIKDRKYALTIGDKRTGKGRLIEELNISFEVKHTIDNSKKSNRATISVWNLQDETIKLFEDEKYLTIYLDVGYDQVGTGNILIGDVLEVKTEKRGTDRVTTITASEGYQALNFSKMPPKNVKTNSKGSTVEEIVEEIRKSMIKPPLKIVQKGNYQGENRKIVVPDGYPLVGTPAQMMNEIADAFYMQWNISGNLLNISDKGGAYSTDKSKAYKFSESSGLVNIPYRHIDSEGKSPSDKTVRNGVTFTALLNPYVKAGDLVFIESKLITGYFKVKDITYKGEYRGDSWFIECYCQDIEEKDK